MSFNTDERAVQGSILPAGIQQAFICTDRRDIRKIGRLGARDISARKAKDPGGDDMNPEENRIKKDESAGLSGLPCHVVRDLLPL